MDKSGNNFDLAHLRLAYSGHAVGEPRLKARW
jgi:hypothetical protein